MVAQEALQALIDTWAPHGPSLNRLTFDGEVAYNILVSGEIDEQWEKYGGWLYFALEKGVEWPLLCPKVFSSLTHQLIYD